MSNWFLPPFLPLPLPLYGTFLGGSLFQLQRIRYKYLWMLRAFSYFGLGRWGYDRMLAMTVHAIALVLEVVLFLSLSTDAQQVLVVSVGREGEELALRFSPEVVYANVGDQVQFQFYPLNHSAVQANFERPCVPISNFTTGQGFFSGFRPLPLDTKTITTFTINITRADPIFFYCSQGRHCQRGFVGVINPTPQKSLEAFKASASLAPENLSPGETPSGPTINPAQRSSPNRFNFTNADNSSSVKNVGAIVGSVLGGVIFLVVLSTLAVFLVMQKQSREEGSDGGVGTGSDGQAW